jgi:hypothetical protein
MTPDAEARPPDASRSKEDVRRALRRVGVSDETIGALERDLPDPVDLDRDANLLFSHGITRDRLMDLLGAAPN